MAIIFLTAFSESIGQQNIIAEKSDFYHSGPMITDPGEIPSLTLIRSGITAQCDNMMNIRKPGDDHRVDYFAQHQSPYRYNIPLQLGIVGAGSLFFLLTPNTEVLAFEDINQLDISNINRLDRAATSFFSPSFSRQSDFIVMGSFFLNGIVPLSFPLLKSQEYKMIPESFKILGMYSGAFLLCYTGKNMVKANVLRARPFLYNPEADYDRQEADARHSFFSGHVALAALNTFFAAKVFSDYFPESRYKAIVWTTAALIPAYTGVLRVGSGKHFTTDVLAGYAFGALCGFVVPYAFSSKRKYSNKLTIYPTNTLGAGGLGIVYRL